MIAGVGFDIYAGQFAAGEAAAILGMKGSVLAMRSQRGFIDVTRRERVGEKSHNKKRTKRKMAKGKPRLSARDIFKARLQQILSEQIGLPLRNSIELVDEAKHTRDQVAERVSSIEAAEIADTVAMTGEWMWAVARAYERGKHLHVYLYAGRPNLKWQFDMHVGNLGEPPCFGWNVPHIYVPISEIFIAVYAECKRMLGLPDQSTVREDM
jgi:hypothetical protein